MANHHSTIKVDRLRRYSVPMTAVLLLAIAQLACSLGGGSVTPGTAPISLTEVGNTMSIGLDSLSAYRATLHMEFNGTRDGARLGWSQDLVLESDKPSSVRLLTMNRKGPDAGQDIEGMLTGQFGKMSIARIFAGAACNAETGATPPTIPDLANLLRPYHTVSFSSSPKERNAISANKATLDAAAVGASPQAKVNGEVWVAIQGGYIVYYDLAIDGTEADWGKGTEGVMHWEYSLEAPGKDWNLLPPVGCPLGIVEAPKPDNAVEISNQPGVLILTTSLDVTAAAKFYQEHFAELGWKESGTAFLTPRNARLMFIKPDRQLVINIQDGPPTEIWITLGRLP
jgi:hypothetical protein